MPPDLAIKGLKMMRGYFPGKLVIGYLGVAFALTCSAQSTSNKTWLSWHFAGTAGIHANANATTVKEIISLPASKALAERLVHNVARAPERQIAGSDAAEHPVRQQLAVGLVEDLLKNESLGAISGPENGAPTLSLGIKLSADGLKTWNQGLRRYLGSLDIPLPEEGAATWKHDNDDGSTVYQMAKKGEWLLFSAGASEFSLVSRWAEQIENNQAPNLSDGEILSLATETAELVKWLTNLSLPSLPSISASFKPEANGVRLEASLELEQAVASELPEWDVPKDLIMDPLVSFSGTRGLTDVIKSFPAAAPLASVGLPDQFYSWARQALIQTNRPPLFPLYLGWPIPNEDIHVGELTQRLPRIVGTDMLTSGSARLVTLPNDNETRLQLLPGFIYPFVRGMTNQNQGVRVAGLFPITINSNYPPAGLFQQLNSEDRLVHYHWEASQFRIKSFKTFFSLLEFLFAKPSANLKGPGMTWLNAIEPRMGNAVTMVTAPEPQRLKLVRKAKFGLTALELAALATWIDSDKFPWIDESVLAEWSLRSFVPTPTLPASK